MCQLYFKNDFCHDNTKCWQRRRETPSLRLCWSERKWYGHFGKRRFLAKLSTPLSHYPAVTLLDVYPGKMKTQPHTKKPPPKCSRQSYSSQSDARETIWVSFNGVNSQTGISTPCSTTVNAHNPRGCQGDDADRKRSRSQEGCRQHDSTCVTSLQ